MKREFYVLQYHLYTLALDQYLTLRWPGYRYDRHFGGCFYLFLRGVDPAKGPTQGVFKDIPSPSLIKALHESLIDRG
jgi:exodeoxyribonuclease V beta subunit